MSSEDSSDIMDLENGYTFANIRDLKSKECTWGEIVTFLRRTVAYCDAPECVVTKIPGEGGVATFRQEGVDAWRKRHSKVFIPVQDDGQQYAQHFDVAGIKRPVLPLLDVFEAVKEYRPMFYNKMEFVPFSRKDPHPPVVANFTTLNSFAGLVAGRG